MRPIATYIEYLLMTRHYAFLPGLGGFVLAEHEAKAKPGMILAPGRTVQFNRFMTHDDGLLANVIMEDTGVSYQEATQRISHEVASMLDRVQHDGRCSIGHLGNLFTDEECHIAFRPADTQRIDPKFYGLDNLHTRPWVEIEKERNAPQTPIIEFTPRRKSDDVIEVPRYWLRRAAIVALIVSFFFCNLFTSSEHSHMNYARMFDAEAIIGHFSTLESQSWDESWESDSYTAPAASTEALPQAAPVTVAEPQATAAIASTAAAPVTCPEKLYYIIIASTTDRADVDRAMKRFAQKGYDNIGVIERDGRLRLYIDNYSVRSDAEAALTELRKIDIFEHAWLLPVRCEQTSSSVLSLVDWTPLQLIIKEKDNDHFTMELSYLNQPAARDQG